jgi:transcriptional regulator with XRE-family HTH domain
MRVDLLNQTGMSPRKQLRTNADGLTAAVGRMWIAFGMEVREARRTRKWTVVELAGRADMSPAFLYAIEAGMSGSIEAAARIASVLGWHAEMHLVNPRKKAGTDEGRDSDTVHSAMGEFEAAHLSRLRFGLGIDEPYQHFQFAGRADLVGWDLDARALLHVENRTRFPDLQAVAGSYNAKRAYLAAEVGARLGVKEWASQTHVIAGLWSAEVLHVLRLRTESFRALCPNSLEPFASWWAGQPPGNGSISTFIVLDPLATGRRRPFIGLEDALAVRPRYRGYADAADQLRSRRNV